MRIERNDINFLGIIRFANLPAIQVDEFKNTATPNVANLQVIEGNGSAVTITNFIGGSNGQPISIVGDGTTTISNNANITTNTGANKLLSVGKVYRFTYLLSTKHWYEDA